MADTTIVQRLLEYDYNEREAKFYANIHKLTEGGTKGITAFELHEGQSLDTILPPRDASGTHWAERVDLERMFTTPEYRRDYFEYYQSYVLPKLVPPKEIVPKSGLRRIVEKVSAVVRKI